MKNQDYIISPERRKRFETQGYKGFNDTELDGITFGIRFANFLCGSLALPGLILNSLEFFAVVLLIAFPGRLLLAILFSLCNVALRNTYSRVHFQCL